MRPVVRWPVKRNKSVNTLLEPQTMVSLRTRCLIGIASLLLAGPAFAAPSLMENLDRGLVAVRSSESEVFLSWRVLGTDFGDTAFNLYRSTDGAPGVLLNEAPITGATNFVDATADLTRANVYSVRPVVFGQEQPGGGSFTVAASAPVQPYLRVPLQRPAGGVTPAGEAYTYSPNDSSVGDLDGDGQYELVVKWDPSNAKDNSQSGYTGNVFLDGYEMDGTLLWRIDLGVNIRAGAHYTQYQVYDLDGDGRAEVACRTAPGSRDGTGAFVAAPALFTGERPEVDHSVDYRNAGGYILVGPEFLTVFSGTTGAELASTNYNPPRHPDTLFPTTAQINAIWGDNYGNRIDRFLAGTAYLDGSRPSLIMCRGYYTRAVIVAYDWRDGQLAQRWIFDTNPNGGPAGEYGDWRGQGYHSLTIGDVDGDGRDEVVYGAAAIDDDGSGLYSTGLGHGDALHMSDMDPDRPGLEVFGVHESPSSYGANGAAMLDAATGALLLGVQASGDIGRGVAFDVDPRYRGFEMWGSGSTGGMYTAQLVTPNAVLGPRGVEIASNKPSINFGVWWDGDLLRELLDNVTVSKWNWTTSTASALLTPAGVASNNGTKATPNLSADILGDWREEIIWRESGNDALRIYTTTTPTVHRIHTLMHDRQYRLAIAWQNTGYNQPPHTSFYLGDGMVPPPAPNIVTSLSVLLGPPAPVLASISDDSGALADDLRTNDTTLVLHGTAEPGSTVNVTRLGVGAVGTASADAGGAWSLDLSGTPLPEGKATFVFSATDADGNTGALSAPYVILVDVTAPDAPAIASVTLDEGALVFAGTVEPGARVEVFLGSESMGVTVADDLGLWSVTTAGPLPPAGANTFSAVATDLAGNIGAASAGVTVDTSIQTPVITGIVTDTGVSNTDGITSDTTIEIVGTAGPGANVSLTRLGDGSIGSVVADAAGQWSFDYTGTVLPDGSSAWVASADAGGVSSPSSPAFVVTIDTAAPSVVSVNRQNPSAAITSAASLTFRVAFSEAVAGIDSTDFTVTVTGDLAGTVGSIEEVSPGVYDVLVGPVSGEGTVRLDIHEAATGITDVAGTALSGGFASGQIYTRSLTGNGTWIQSSSGGAWSVNGNWQEGIVGSGAGTTADFSTLELVEDNTVVLDSPRTVGNLIFGDTDIISAASWTIDDGGDASHVLTLGTVSGTPTITVNPLGLGATTTFAASLAGNQGVNKLGTGSIILTRPNTLTGVVNINGGTVTLRPGSSLGNGNAQLNLGTNTSLIVDGGDLSNGNLVTAVSSSLVVNSGTANLLNFRTNSDFGGTLRINGGTVTVNDINIRRNSAANPDFGSGVIVAGGTTTANTIGLGTNNSTGAMSVEGGSVTVTGPLTIANQATGGRGGALRVLGGTFTSTNTTDGIIITRRNNNVGSATFSGGVSTAERVILGYDATVASGSGTLRVNGGALYLGSGGIVANGSGTFTTTVDLSAGVLGAKADWSSALSMTLSNPGTIALRAADAADQPFTITLAGVISGAGGFEKTGSGALVLSGENTYQGTTTVSAGTLVVSGSLNAAANPVLVTSGGRLGGAGMIARPVTLGSGGTIQPGSPALTADSVTWDGGGVLSVDLAAAQRLDVTGALARGAAGPLQVAVASASAPAVGSVYTLATFASTDLTTGDLVLTTADGFLGTLELDTGELRFVVTGAGASAEFTHWAHLAGLPAGQAGPEDNPSGDGIPNLLKFVLGLDPTTATSEGLVATTVEAEAGAYPAVAFVRRKELGGIQVEVLVAPDLHFTTDLGAVEVSATDNGDGTETVVVRSAVPASEQPTQFFRIAATLPEN